MRYILAGLGEGDTSDIVFIPVAFNYDRVPEDTTLLAHQDQGFTQKSKIYAVKSTLWHSLGVAARMLGISQQRFGQAAVSFGAPMSARDWLIGQGGSVQALDDEGRKAIVAPIAEAVIGQITNIIPVLPVSLVSTFVLQNSGDRFSDRDIQKGVSQLIEQLRLKEAPLAIDETDDLIAYRRGIEVLLSRNVLVEEGGMFHLNQEKTALLEYYARTISHYLDDQDAGEHLRSILTVREPAEMNIRKPV